MNATARSARTVLIMLAIGLLVGLPSGWAAGKLIKAVEIQNLPWSDAAALIIAMVFMGTGLVMVVLSASRSGRAILANPNAPEFARPVSRGQSVLFWCQGGVLLLAGVMLAAPVTFEILVKRPSHAAGTSLMIAIVGAFVLQTALNLAIWRQSDEVLRKAIAQSGAATFWLLQGVFFLWASGEKLKLLPAITSWDAVTVMMGVYLIASSVIACQRGLT